MSPIDLHNASGFLLLLIIALNPAYAQQESTLGSYSTDFSQITIGGEASESTNYSTEDALSVGATTEIEQSGDFYSVSNTLLDGDAPSIGEYLDFSMVQGVDVEWPPSAPPSDVDGDIEFVVVLPTTLPNSGTLDVDPSSGTVSIVTNGDTDTGQYFIKVTVTDQNEFYDEDAFIMDLLSSVEVWVDFFDSGPHLGTSGDPLSDLAIATDIVSNGGTVKIKPGSSPDPITIDRPMRIEAPSGTVRIGSGL